ncbi:dethiobiotin synthase [Muriicola sp. Z0-33]|uniref:dethiobiotin synthase n=1 Tax=Muriicola sp. Z0-33 TaxID=2816957 RepID=UPI0022375765|nr:dethiobiotin synthase [Muriicola sp. Z0-33]MCW5514955.1 dethiobiotin synthase [Muriicola sp. Z0-33]
MKRIFVTGISTEVGKTLAAAIITEALEADYWKPVQAGDLNDSDSHKIASLISNTKTKIHQNSYALNTPMSPHAAAEIDGISINTDQIVEPRTNNHLVIEGAGGILVPINNTETIADIIQPTYKVVVVSRHYLGSINHSLLTIDYLQKSGFDVSIIFNGEPHQSTESIILKKTGVPSLGRIFNEAAFTKEVIKRYAAEFRSSLTSL